MPDYDFTQSYATFKGVAPEPHQFTGFRNAFGNELIQGTGWYHHRR
jgi:hypothetical protein